ncbi:MAG: hypothetical protein IJU40_01655, partial [Desulfovibrionaceae bacterium]|nr:hypothetical protein [Desulfovibrionaceae bacterium]
MKGLRVQFLSVEPLIISDGTTEGLTHKCLDFIPGNMLLGALAAKWKKMNPGVDPDSSKEFCALFLQNKVSFGHVWPNCQGRPAYPTPLSLVYEKNSKGLPALELNATEPPKVYNLLADPKLDFATQEFNHLPSTFLDLETKHVPALKRLHVTHIGIDPKKRLVSDFQIFSYEAISSGVSWICTIVCEDDTLSSLQKLFKDPTPLQLGHGRSSGYGSIRLIKVNPLDIKSEIEVTPGEHSLYLESAFFPDNSWKNPIEALVQLLESSLKAKVELNLNKTYIENFRLEGFNSLWRLPRSTRFGLAQGSVIT